MDDEGHRVPKAQRVEQREQVLLVFSEGVCTGAAVRNRIGIAHSDHVGGDASSKMLHMGTDLAPQMRGGRVPVKEDNRVPFAHIVVRMCGPRRAAFFLRWRQVRACAAGVPGAAGVSERVVAARSHCRR
jgi:hypothetical protein